MTSVAYGEDVASGGLFKNLAMERSALLLVELGPLHPRSGGKSSHCRGFD